ncbi:hypothetical protein BSFA1_85920 (plasmid) [Burkholderia sp. SFA1]|nr:hypothetical protein BSFA1_85920 [Burkholderia sp. SFA1]
MPATSHTFTEENVRTRAYLLWEAGGRAHGRDDHYWCEAVAQLEAESIQPSLSSSAESEVVAVEKTQKTSNAGKSAAKKVAKNTAEADDKAKAKVSAKGSKKAATEASGQVLEAVFEPKTAAKKSKTPKKESEISESGTTPPVPARPKKPRKTASDESKVPAQRPAE